MTSDAEPLDRQRYWRDWYRTLLSSGREVTSLDYSGDEARGRILQTQTIALVLEAGGAPAGLRCLDAGCGWGQLSRCLDAFGGRVTALDMTSEVIAAGRASFPSIEWREGNFLDPSLLASLGRFDRVYSVEALQCAGPLPSIRSLWSLVAPGGRLVVSLPNAADPLIQKVSAALPGRYDGLTPHDLLAALGALDGCDYARVRGLTFGADQRISPYQVTPWSAAPDWSTPPNRLMAVAIRAA